MEINFVNSTSFEMSSPVLIDMANELYQVMNEWMKGLMLDDGYLMYTLVCVCVCVCVVSIKICMI